MYFALIIIAIIICVFLGLIVLIQNPKGGGLTSGFAGTNNIMGVQRTGDFLEKGTWGLAAALMVLILLINVSVPKGGESAGSGQELQKQISKPAAPITPFSGGSATPEDSSKK
jgi:preprotein translocase subunit SecG